ncbi:putative Ig domain-containing protein [uncultured Ferrimonas sp.]|uniref:putative Ig domain-containing protein n=1 Tax=uncultured Ferrimonas sp. TaxID=432640 RepID=UPI0026137623|nr:putative Ig domain-containing protein [uncultured Ferrimonas sp.]
MQTNHFTLSKLALCVSLAVAPSALLASQQTDARLQHVSAEQATQTNDYIVALSTPGSWKSGDASAEQAQQRLLAYVRSLDAEVQVVASNTKLTNSLHLRVSAAVAAQLQQHADVASLSQFHAQATTVDTSIQRIQQQQQQAAMAAMPALTDMADAGKGVKIAILSTGIDYTHVALGGDGSEDSYNSALANAATDYDGFPTAVVTGGHDFATEAGFGEDQNPLDGNLEFTNWNGYEFPTGRGTMLASLVHRLAPGAELMAYKVAGVSDPYGNGPQMTVPSIPTIANAIEHAVEAGADIIMVDHSIYGYHVAAYNEPGEGQGSPLSLDIEMVATAAAKGVLVVSTAGAAGTLPSKYNIAWMGAADDALTVGGIVADGDNAMSTAEWSPHGPVRGSQTIKPDLVSYASDDALAVAGSGDQVAALDTPDLSVARMAAAAAIIQSSRADLSNLEIKALLTNTANHNINRNGSGQQASVTQIGSGIENIDAALTTPVALWEQGSNQPHLSFGHQVVDNNARLMKEIVLRNYSDSAQTYQLSMEVGADRDGNAAINWSYPASVTVPANSTITVPMILEIDGANLPQWALTKTDDYSIENWEKMELNGYLQLSAESQPTLSMGWSVLPRAKGEIKRHFETFEDYFDGDHTLPWSQFTEGRKQSFTNAGAHTMNMMALPIMHSRVNRPESKYDTNNLMKHAAGGVFDAQQCDSGKKMVLATNMHAPMDIAMSNHFDKLGEMVVYFDIFSNDIVVQLELDKVVAGQPYVEDSDRIGYGWVSLDANGQPVTTIIDLNQPYDHATPTARYKQSKLPAYFVPGGTNVVAQFCLEEMYHHDVDSVEDFDQEMGFIFSTDRDAFPDLGEPIVMFNPVKYGAEVTTTRFDWFSGMEIESTSYGTAELRMNKIGADGVEGDDWSMSMELAPGESAMFYAQKDGACGGPSLGGGDGCSPSGMLLMDLNSDLTIAGESQPTGNTVTSVKANQHFDVAENIENGTVIGQLENDIPGFFGLGGPTEDEWRAVDFQLARAIPGNPVTVETDGTIIVANSAAFDYENQQQLMLQVQTRQGNLVTPEQAVYINISNVNDIAPTVTGSLDAVSITEGDAVNLSLAGLFSDAEGDLLTYTVSGLPEGVNFDADSMTISGTPTMAGEYTVTVEASDGTNTATSSTTISVAEQPSSSSGSLGFGLPLLAWLMWRRRR